MLLEFPKCRRPLPKPHKLVFLFKTPDTFDQHHRFIFASLFVASDAALPLMVVISSSILKSGLSKQEQNDRRQLFLGGQWQLVKMLAWSVKQWCWGRRACWGQEHTRNLHSFHVIKKQK